jgi:hypothetical protein
MREAYEWFKSLKEQPQQDKPYSTNAPLPTFMRFSTAIDSER